MIEPSLIPQSALVAANALSQHLLRVVRPCFWQRNGRILSGGSAFILRFEKRYVAVTADHVIQHYLMAVGRDPAVKCQLGQCFISPREALISRSQELDIATFEVDPTKLKAMGAEPVDCRSDWPPPSVHVGDTLSLAGYLDNHRFEVEPGYYRHEAWGGHGLVEDVTARTIVTAYSYDQTAPLHSEAQQPPMKFNMSGCSGGLAVLVRNVEGKLKWTPAALIYKGPTGESHGGFADFDMIHLRPLSFIGPDGTIGEGSADMRWLPS